MSRVTGNLNLPVWQITVTDSPPARDNRMDRLGYQLIAKSKEGAANLKRITLLDSGLGLTLDDTEKVCHCCSTSSSHNLNAAAVPP
jgi:hypothetical protein